MWLWILHLIKKVCIVILNQAKVNKITFVMLLEILKHLEFNLARYILTQLTKTVSCVISCAIKEMKRRKVKFTPILEPS